MYERTRYGTTLHFQKAVQASDAYPRMKDGKIKRTSFARRFACKKLSAHCFSTRGANEQAKRGGAFFDFCFLTRCRETAVQDHAAVSPPLLRHSKQVCAVWRQRFGRCCKGYRVGRFLSDGRRRQR